MLKQRIITAILLLAVLLPALFHPDPAPFCALTLLLILVVLMPFASLIPMPVIAAILLMVAYHMSGWRTFAGLCKSAPKSDILVLVATFVLTVVFDLVVAIGVGMKVWT